MPGFLIESMRAFLADFLETVSLKYPNQSPPISWREFGHAILEKMESPSYARP